ncbi:MAG: SapC family protein [Candidatus Competibacteraceae bacterium]|nr:SapC family protein [Candidatus Competibacteraceae bacterium]
MATQLLFYSNAVPVSSQKHGGLYVKTGKDFSFARSVNSVPLTAVEFRRATLEYAVVFAGEGEAVMPVAILGAEAEQNLFVKDDGSWDGNYIPAFVRRYPFVFSSSKEGTNFTLCIDEGFSGCNQEGRGERLFDAEGQRTQYLETVLNFVRDYQIQFQRTRNFCNHLRELNLLEPMQAQFTLPSGQQRNLTGFMAVNRTKLKDLDDEVLARMAKNDELELVYLHLQSMQNFDSLVRRIGAKPKAEAVAEGDAPFQAEKDGAPPIH